MRTDSNTVLSLPSGVPPKKSALTKASTNNGTTFANDFNRAKETLAPKKAPATDKVAAPSSSVSSSANSSSATTKVLDKNAASTNSKDKVSTSSAASSAVVAVTAQAVSQDSGKALQQDGEVSPADGLLVAVSTEDSELPVTAAPSGLQSAPWMPASFNACRAALIDSPDVSISIPIDTLILILRFARYTP